MSSLDTSSTTSLDAPAIVALGLLGAGVGVGAAAILQNPDNRAACARIVRELGLPQMARDVAAGLLLKFASSVAGGDGVGNADVGRSGRWIRLSQPGEPTAGA